jgi:hypothetical protein
MIVRKTEEMNEDCRSANHRPQAMIVRSYRMDPVELNVKLEQKIRLPKIENNEKKNKTKIKD